MIADQIGFAKDMIRKKRKIEYSIVNRKYSMGCIFQPARAQRMRLNSQMEILKMTKTGAKVMNAGCKSSKSPKWPRI